MQKYTVLNDNGVQLEENAVVFAKGTVLELDPERDVVKTLVASGDLEAVANEEKVAEPLKEVGPFSITVEWMPDSTEEDMQAANKVVADLAAEANANPGEFPSCVKSLTVSRI